MNSCWKDCLILIPFRLPRVSCFTLSLKYFSFDSNNCPAVVIGLLLQFPHPVRAGPVLLTLIFPPRSFVLLSFAWFHVFFSTHQVLLSTLSWHSACTSVSDGVFLMYPWREMYSTSTYSSTILFFYLLVLSKLCILNDSDLTSRELNKANLTLNLPYSYQFVTLNNFTYFSRVWSLCL